MRLLLTTDTVGGVWTYAMELARALAPMGAEILLATMGAPLTAAQRDELATLPHVRVAESAYKLEWMDDPWDDVAAAGRWLLDLEQTFQPDVVHLNGYAHGSLPWAAPVLVAAHSCVLSWWQAVKGEPAPASWDRYRQAATDGLRDADLVVAPSAAMLSATDHYYGPLPRTRVIWNGRAPELFRDAAAKHAKDPIILSAGRLWDEAKNAAILDRVADRLPWPVYVAGHDRDSTGRGVGLKSVRPLGMLPAAELADWLARASIYALPARYEPFGYSAVEAAYAGCALVLGDIPSLREVWGDAAVFVPPDDADALVAAIGSLADDPVRRKDLAHRAGERAARYTRQRMAEEYMAAYRELLAGRTAGSVPNQPAAQCREGLPGFAYDRPPSPAGRGPE